MARHIVRDARRRHLVTGVSNEVGGAPVRSFTYSHDALGRPVRRIDATPSGTSTNTFSYNARSEVVSAFLGGVAATYSYDPAGNRTASSSGASPSSYAANALNQYETVAAGNATNSLVHDEWGNLVQTAHHTCYYAWGNLLECVCTNRTRFKPPCAFFSYDALGRRCRKSSTPYGGHDWTHRYCHSGWLLLLEEVKKGAGIPFEPVHYVWGRDLSGTLDGAGGVGGLLATEVGGVWYFPLYDANGNVTDYVSETGEVVASYAYDAFGRTLAQSGPMADVFPFRFSTKYYDSETGLYYYGRRYYSPDLGRWLNRDPIEEDGGVNLYAFCGNNGVGRFDALGLLAVVLDIDPMGGEKAFHDVTSIKFKNSFEQINKALTVLKGIEASRFASMVQKNNVKFDGKPVSWSKGTYVAAIEREKKSQYIRGDRAMYAESLEKLKSLSSLIKNNYDILAFTAHGHADETSRNPTGQTVFGAPLQLVDTGEVVNGIRKIGQTVKGRTFIIICYRTWDGQGDSNDYVEGINIQQARTRVAYKQILYPNGEKKTTNDPCGISFTPIKIRRSVGGKWSGPEIFDQ